MFTESILGSLRWLLLAAFLGVSFPAVAGYRVHLAYPGESLHHEYRPKNMKLATWVEEQRWSALSIKDGALVVTPVTATTETDWVSASGKVADRLLEGKPVKQKPKAVGLALDPPPGTLVLARFEGEGMSKGLNPGSYPGLVPLAVLREGWTASAELNGHKWKLYTRSQKRPDGKMLAGSLEILADLGNRSMVLIPEASGMAFEKQELLWVGDLDGNDEPDLLLKRTRLTGEIDYVLGVAPLFGLISHDPDQPGSYFSSGVEPDSNGITWNKNRSLPQRKFINQGRFAIGEEEWIKKLNPNTPLRYRDPTSEEAAPPLDFEAALAASEKTDPLALPILLTDRKFKLGDETIRVTLEHLPRAPHNPASSASGDNWGGDVLVNVVFRGRSQVLMEAGAPDSGVFQLSVGYMDGNPAIKVDHQPHYNNSFTTYWIYDKPARRFRRVWSEHSQGC